MERDATDPKDEVVLVSRKRLDELEALERQNNRRWWEAEGIQIRRAGVFEGGGAKVVAAGLKPERILELTVSALKAMSSVRGIGRLRDGEG
jgi:hypothetical protein